MPELPEIEISRQRLDPKILSRPIQEIAVLDQGLLKEADESSVRRELVGSAFTGIARFGDFLVLEVTEPSSGGAEGDGAGVLLLALSPTASIEQVRPHDEPPRSTRLGLRFNDGGGLAVVDPRNRTWLSFITDAASAPDLGTFGPDALNGRIDPERWWQELQHRRAQIKGLLLEPALIAGLGPTYTDEILFQAGIRPDRKASDLTREEADRLRETASATIDKAVRCQAKPDQLPKTYLTRARTEGLEACPKCGGDLEKRQVQGRATWFCPTCQS